MGDGKMKSFEQKSHFYQYCVAELTNKKSVIQGKEVLRLRILLQNELFIISLKSPDHDLYPFITGPVTKMVIIHLGHCSHNE